VQQFPQISRSNEAIAFIVLVWLPLSVRRSDCFKTNFQAWSEHVTVEKRRAL